MCGLSLVAVSRGYSSLHGLLIAVASRCGIWALGAWALVVVARGLSSCGTYAVECRLSSCGAWAWLLCGMWDLPRPRLEPMSPALTGGFLTTGPPGKKTIFYMCIVYHLPICISIHIVDSHYL